jgi:hypothetical protein
VPAAAAGKEGEVKLALLLQARADGKILGALKP